MAKENSGRFKKGNTIGSKTRFQPGNDASSKYREEYCEKMLEYFNDPEQNGGFPTFELFASSIHVVSSTLWEWCGKHPRFKITYDECMTIQKGLLLRGGVTGVYNPAMVKFMAVNCHGMQDKTAVAVGNDGEKPFTVEIKVIDDAN